MTSAGLEWSEPKLTHHHDLVCRLGPARPTDHLLSRWRWKQANLFSSSMQTNGYHLYSNSYFLSYHQPRAKSRYGIINVNITYDKGLHTCSRGAICKCCVGLYFTWYLLCCGGINHHFHHLYPAAQHGYCGGQGSCTYNVLHWQNCFI